jgi:hypothetical protein
VRPRREPIWDRFTPIASGDQPRSGDVLLYAESTPFHQLTNIVARG